MMRKTFLVLSGMMAATFSLAVAAGDHAPAGKPQAWTPASLSSALADMPKGDAVRGKQLHHDQFCASCHGVAGESTTMNWPSLAGQRAEYTYKMLLDYQSRLRREDERADIMVAAAHPLTRQDMADLAAYYAAQPLPNMQEVKDANVVAEKLVRHGDPTRLITPCASCHGLHGQGGINETPALSGMTPEYFVRTMKYYRDGKRNNDSVHAMRAFAKSLTDEEIEALALYYAPSAK